MENAVNDAHAGAPFPFRFPWTRDGAHCRFAEAVASGAQINEDEAERGFQSLVVALAAQAALDLASSRVTLVR